jgi:hypothetical protein
MAVDTDARRFTLSYTGGYFTATQGLLKFLWGQDFMEKVGAGKSMTIAVKGHTRERVIGLPTIPVAGYSYGTIKYPRRVKGGSAGGQPIQVFAGGTWWTCRLGGSVQDFKAYLAGTGKPQTTFTFATEKGGEYSSAS